MTGVAIAIISLLSACLLLWGYRLALMFHVMRTDPFLRGDEGDGLTGEAPLVSVIIPVRNEARNVGPCLDALLAQDYANLEIIVANDRSEDATARIVREYAEKFPRVRLVEVKDLPEGWTGKTHALHVGSRHAHGDWLLFVDADTRHVPTNVSSAIAFSLQRKADMLSLLCGLIAEGFWEKALQPLCGTILMMHNRLSRINDPSSGAAFANGQYILIRREVYDEVGGHEAVRGHLLEDIALATRVKRAGRRLVVAWGVTVSHTRMYTTLSEIFRGWSRIYLAGFEGRLWILPLTLVAILLVALAPIVTAAATTAALLAGVTGTFTWTLFLLSVPAVAFLWFIQLKLYRLAQVPLGWALFHPMSLVILFLIVAYAIWQAYVRGTVTWRGRAYAAGT